MFLAAAIPPDVEIQRKLTSMHIAEWLREDVFQLRWWLLIILLALSLYLWWKLADKKRLPEMILYVTLATIVVMASIEYGEELTLWSYPTDLIPIFPPLTSINLFALPLIYSLIHQFFRTKKSFLWAMSRTRGNRHKIKKPIVE